LPSYLMVRREGKGKRRGGKKKREIAVPSKKKRKVQGLEREIFPTKKKKKKRGKGGRDYVHSAGRKGKGGK